MMRGIRAVRTIRGVGAVFRGIRVWMSGVSLIPFPRARVTAEVKLTRHIYRRYKLDVYTHHNAHRHRVSYSQSQPQFLLAHNPIQLNANHDLSLVHQLRHYPRSGTFAVALHNNSSLLDSRPRHPNLFPRLPILPRHPRRRLLPHRPRMRPQRMSRHHLPFPIPLNQHKHDNQLHHQHDHRPPRRRPRAPHLRRHHLEHGHRHSLSDRLLPMLSLLQRRLLSRGTRLRRHIVSDGRIVLGPGFQRRDDPRGSGRDCLWRWWCEWNGESHVCGRVCVCANDDGGGGIDDDDDSNGGRCGELCVRVV